MSAWRLTLQQVEAGYAPWRWEWDNCYTKERKRSEGWFDSVEEALADAKLNKPKEERRET